MLHTNSKITEVRAYLINNRDYNHLPSDELTQLYKDFIILGIPELLHGEGNLLLIPREDLHGKVLGA